MTNYNNYYKALEYLDVYEDGSVWIKERSWIAGWNNVKRFHKRQKAKFYMTNWGYYRFNISIEGKTYKLLPHVLVALVHVQKPEGWDETWQVNHRNGIKTDCRKENLEWVTPSQNIKHAFDNWLKNNEVLRVSRGKSVQMLNKETGEIIETYISIHEAARKRNLSFGNINQCCLNNRKTCGGYRWCYVNNLK